MKQRIYLDNNASTPIDMRVFDIITNDLKNNFGNPSSSHSLGQEVRNRLTKARHFIASFLGVKHQEIIFTSGGTESINMGLRGYFEGDFSGHVITSSVEHSSVYATLKRFESLGCEVSFLSPGLHGAITVDAVRGACRPNTRLISLMAVNNETGVKTDIEKIATFANERHIPFLVDGVALLGKEPFVIPKGVSVMCFSGHKFHAPKGIGFAFVRQGLKLSSLLTGGDQEFGRRGGTENISGILGLAEAISILKAELSTASLHMKKLRDHFESSILESLPGVYVNGSGERIANTSNLSFSGIDGESLLIGLDLEGVVASHGSACASGALEPSRILLNMGIPLEVARSSIRFSLSRFTTEEEIDRAIQIIVKVVKRLRS